MSIAGCQSLSMTLGESFHFEGTLPADFRMRAQAYYGVDNRAACLGKPQITRSFENNLQPQPHDYRFNIPLSYYDSTCHMRLARVDFFIHGRYGEFEWQERQVNGQFQILEHWPNESPFSEDGVLIQQTECSWLLKFSEAWAPLRKNIKSDILSCTGADVYLPPNKLAGKTVRLNIQINTET